MKPYKTTAREHCQWNFDSKPVLFVFYKLNYQHQFWQQLNTFENHILILACVFISWAHSYSSTSAHISASVCEIVCTFLQSCVQTELSHKLREKEMTENREMEEEHKGEGLKSLLHSHKEEDSESERERERLKDYKRGLMETLGRRTNVYEELNK